MIDLSKRVAELEAELDRKTEALKAIASHDNIFLTDGSAATRFCLDWMVATARAGLAVPS